MAICSMVWKSLGAEGWVRGVLLWTIIQGPRPGISWRMIQPTLYDFSGFSGDTQHRERWTFGATFVV